MRIAGFAGACFRRWASCRSRSRAVTSTPALEKGTIDAAEWVGPYDDEKLGFYKVAKYYYYPGWWEGGAMIHIHINKEKWESLPANYKAILRAAASQSAIQLIGKYTRSTRWR